MDERTKKAAGAEGELMRTYRNANGEEVRVSIVCGRLLDMTDHTPDRCYPAAGFDMQAEPQREVFETPGGEAEFMAASFMKSEASGAQAVRGYWSYSGDGKWSAPDNAKTSLASQKNACYKLYVFAPISTVRGEQAGDIAVLRGFRAGLHSDSERNPAAGIRESRPRGGRSAAGGEARGVTDRGADSRKQNSRSRCLATGCFSFMNRSFPMAAKQRAAIG